MVFEKNKFLLFLKSKKLLSSQNFNRNFYHLNSLLKFNVKCWSKFWSKFWPKFCDDNRIFLKCHRKKLFGGLNDTNMFNNSCVLEFFKNVWKKNYFQKSWWKKFFPLVLLVNKMVQTFGPNVQIPLP